MSEKISDIHKHCIEKNLTFATFRLPRQSSHTTYIQTSTEAFNWSSIHDITEKKGFIMAPFDNRNGKKYLMVKPDIVFEGDNPGPEIIERILSIKARSISHQKKTKPVVTEKPDYLKQVKTIKKNISTGYFQKAVLSRIIFIPGDFTSIATLMFKEACKKHPNAFVYIFKSDEHFWLGASPEPLLRLRDGIVSTVSLAGTRSYSKSNMEVRNWTMKEILEQEYVTRYIHDILREFQIRDYRVTSPYVKKAADLLHLRSDFSFKYDHVADKIWEFLDALHPTPAVAGQPKEEAIAFIKQLEPHDREYYTGFLGPVQSNEVIDLFVNLRCMKISPDHIALYIGGGITLESEPEEEWEETRLKAKSLLNIIDLLSKKKDDKTSLKAAYS